MNASETADAASAIHPPLGRKVPYADELEGAEMTDAMVEELLAGPLRDLAADEKRFPSLRGIIRYDTRVVRFEEGGVVIRQGDYGDSAFVILRGRVHIPLKPSRPNAWASAGPADPTSSAPSPGSFPGATPFPRPAGASSVPIRKRSTGGG